MDMKHIRERIKARREELDLSYQDLATRTGLSKSTLQRYETGNIKNMPLDKLSVLSKALNVDEVWILGLTESKPGAIKETKTDIKEVYLLEGFNKLNESGKDKVIEKFLNFFKKIRLTNKVHYIPYSLVFFLLCFS